MTAGSECAVRLVEVPRAARQPLVLELPAHEADTETVVVIEPEPMYNVVLIDDDDHTYDYVVEMLCKIFGHSVNDAFEMAREVDASGRVIVDTTHRERAELKRDQIRSFGPDPLLLTSRGSMHATIEPLFS